jgi:hypothetical protein
VRKYSVLLLVLVAVLALNSLALAYGGGGSKYPQYQWETDGFAQGSLKNNQTVTRSINVTGTVGPYAAIRLMQEKEGRYKDWVTLNEASLEWEGRAQEKSSDKVDFQIESNTHIDLKVVWKPLEGKYTYKENHMTKEDTYRIDTTVKVLRGNDQLGSGTATVEKNSQSFIINKIQGVTKKDYKLEVEGKLRDISSQAATDYQTVVTLIVSKS